MKKLLGLLTVGLVVGTALYITVNRKKDKVATTSKKDTTTDKTESNVSIEIKNNTDSLNYSFNRHKDSTMNTMINRHKDAAETMNDSVEIIFERSKVSDDENRDLDNISDELDALLSED